jgi:hypothetical protein
VKLETVKDSTLARLPPSEDTFKQHDLISSYNSSDLKHNLYYKRIFRCIRGPAKSQVTFDLQPILVQDQTFHLYNHAQEVIQLLALKYVQLTISLLGTGEDLRTCCLNVSSLGGSLTKVESLTVSNFTRNLFRSIWHTILFEGQMSSDFLQDLV